MGTEGLTAPKIVGLSMDRYAVPQQLKMSMEHNQEFVRTEQREGLRMALQQSKHITTHRLNSSVPRKTEKKVWDVYAAAEIS